MIRRDALRIPYVKDHSACIAIREAGFRVGWTPGIRAVHLGWDDYRLHPRYLASKNALPSPFAFYPASELIGRPPTLAEIARSAPLVAELRRACVPYEAVLELAWGDPILGPALDAVTTLHPPPPRLPLQDGEAGAAVLVLPPPENAQDALADAARVATTLVVAVAPLRTFDGRAASELAPAGWSGREVAGIGTVPLELARQGDEIPMMKTQMRYTTLEEREQWLSLFAAAAIPPETDERLFVFTAHGSPTSPERITTAGLPRWNPQPRPDPIREQPSWRWRARHALATHTPAPLLAVWRAASRHGR
jgi:hypothetical protein